eukprot:jgi/Ulvmu1/5739/UM245_0007.1
MQGSLYPCALLQESSVGFVLPPDPPPLGECGNATGRVSFFCELEHRSANAARFPKDSGLVSHAHDAPSQGRHSEAGNPGGTSEMPIPMPIVSVVRHMHVPARRGLLDAMLRLGPDSSQFASYSATFCFPSPDGKLHRLLRTSQPPQALVQSMEVVAAQIVKPVAVRATLRERVYTLLSDPMSSRAARAVSAVILSGICVSTGAYCYETMPGVPRGPVEAARLQVVEVAMVALFTVEYAARFACCPHLRRFLTSPMNSIDVLSVLPYYVSLLSEQLLGGWARRGVTRVLRVVRLVRIFRVVKVGARYTKIRIIATVVRDTMEILWLLVLLVGLAVLVFSTLVYYIELMELQADPDDPRVTFRSIPATFWWSVVTLLTVGYGDVVPGTASGKAVAAVSMVVAVLLMALPVSVIGTTFTQHWVAFRVRERREARTLHAHDTLCDLVSLLAAHTQAMEDIAATVEKCCVRLRLCLHELYRLEESIRNTYISGISGSAMPRHSASQLSAQVGRSYLELESVLTVAESIMDPELIALARGLDESYLQLAWWFAEAHHLIHDYAAIMHEAESVQALLERQPPIRRIRL